MLSAGEPRSIEELTIPAIQVGFFLPGRCVQVILWDRMRNDEIAVGI